MDQDIISLDKIPVSHQNFVVPVKEDRIASAIFRLQRGHPVLQGAFKILVYQIMVQHSLKIRGAFRSKPD